VSVKKDHLVVIEGYTMWSLYLNIISSYE